MFDLDPFTRTFWYFHHWPLMLAILFGVIAGGLALQLIVNHRR
jgi:uncharacterized integral membrane protein